MLNVNAIPLLCRSCFLLWRHSFPLVFSVGHCWLCYYPCKTAELCVDLTSLVGIRRQALPHLRDGVAIGCCSDRAPGRPAARRPVAPQAASRTGVPFQPQPPASQPVFDFAGDSSGYNAGGGNFSGQLLGGPLVDLIGGPPGHPRHLLPDAMQQAQQLPTPGDHIAGQLTAAVFSTHENQSSHFDGFDVILCVCVCGGSECVGGGGGGLCSTAGKCCWYKLGHGTRDLGVYDERNV